MNNRLFIRAVYAAVMGHSAALLFLLFANLIAMSADNPDGVALPISLIALGVGAVMCGAAARRMRLGVLGGALAGLIFAALPFAVSTIGKSKIYSVGERLMIFVSLIALAAIVAALVPKKTKAGNSVGKRKKAMYKKLG